MSTDPHDPATAGHAWQRLSARMIWVDLVQSVLSLLPAVVAVLVVGIQPGAGQLWPLFAIAAFGILGAAADALRWVVTRYRITDTHVELRTGILYRQHRSLRRERVRSVDIEAKLRHRLSGLRVVAIGAGQQSAAGESALSLDAVTTADALGLQAILLSPAPASASAETPPTTFSEDERRTPDVTADPRPRTSDSAAADHDTPLRVFARFRPHWVVYNMFNAWGYLLALGLGWGGLWLLSSVGVDLFSFVTGLLDWGAIGWAGTVLIAFLAVSAIGAAGLTVNYFTEFWNFELSRIRGREGTMLRTRKGLFTTREVNRDENRIRGIDISEPLVWRWMGVSDTSVVTTGLDLWSMSDPTAILPRTHVHDARRIAAEVLGAEEDPLRAPLTTHPRAALRRRLWWATGLTAVLALVLLWLAVTEVVPFAALWAAAGFWPLALGGAVIAYRSLGHAIVGPYLVTRSGLSDRSTTALQRSAVSTIVVRESVLQRRLGLRTVSTMTAAGYGRYDTLDLDADASLEFAQRAAPGLLDPFLTPQKEASDHRPRQGA